MQQHKFNTLCAGNKIYHICITWGLEGVSNQGLKAHSLIYCKWTQENLCMSTEHSQNIHKPNASGAFCQPWTACTEDSCCGEVSAWQKNSMSLGLMGDPGGRKVTTLSTCDWGAGRTSQTEQHTTTSQTTDCLCYLQRTNLASTSHATQSTWLC